MALRSDGHDGNTRFDERDGPVLELGGGVPLGVDVGDLLQLERAFQRHGISGVAADEQHVAGALIPFGQRPHLIVQRQGPLDLFGQRIQLADPAGNVDRKHHGLGLGQVEGQEIHRRHLREKGLRGGDAALGSGMRVQNAVGLPGDG